MGCDFVVGIDEDKRDKEFELLRANIAQLIASDVMRLTARYNVELSQRLFAFSISGDELCKFDYGAIVFCTGIDRKKFSKQCWNQMVTELKLPQSEPFEVSKWNALQKNQLNVIENAKKFEKKIQNLKKNMNKKINAPKDQKSDARADIRSLSKINDLEMKTDNFLPIELLKVKERQMNLLTTLHDLASIVGMDSRIVAKIETSARKQSEQELANYLNGNANVKVLDKQSNGKVDAMDIEERQLKLLSTIYSTRKQLEQLAASKGVSMDELNVDCIDITKLDKQFDALFSDLANMALSVQQTATQYDVKLDDSDVNKHIAPMYTALERKQNALLAKGNYLQRRIDFV